MHTKVTDYFHRICFDIREAVSSFASFMSEHMRDEVLPLRNDGFLGFDFVQDPQAGWTQVGWGETQMMLHMGEKDIGYHNLCKLQAEFEKIKDLPEDATAFVQTLRTEIDSNQSGNARKTVIRFCAQRLLDKIAADKQLVAPDGTVYIPLGRNASAIRKGDALLCTPEVHDDLIDFNFLGRFERLKELVSKAKLEVYGLLDDSSTHDFPATFGKDIGMALAPYNLYNGVVLKDVKYDTDKTFIDKLGADEELRMNVLEAITDTKTDGLVIHVLKDQNPYVKKVLAKGQKHLLKACSVRLNGLKALKVIVTESAYKALLDRIGERELVDAYGRKVDIYERELIVFTSALKTWKAFDSWKDFVDECKARNVEMRVCVNCRHKITAFPTQQVRGMHMRPEFIRKAVEYTTSVTDNWKTPDGAANLVGGAVGDIGSVYPTFWNTIIANRSLQGAYNSKLQKIYRGNMIDVATMAFVAPELPPIFYVLFGKDPEFALGKNRVRIDGVANNVPVLLSRAPFPKQNYMFSFNTEVSKELENWFLGGVCFINWKNVWMTLAQMDFDGDKVNIVVIDTPFKQAIWDEALAAVKRFDYRPLWFESNASPKPWSDDAEWEDIRITSPAPVGLYDNALTIMAGDWERLFHRDTPEETALAFRVKSARQEKGMTVCTDDAKHNGEPSQEAVDDQTWLYQKKRAKKDEAYAMKKISLNNPGEYQAEIETRKYGKCFNDPIAQFSLRMGTILPEVLEINGAQPWNIRESWKPMTTGKQSGRIYNLVHVPESQDERDAGNFGIFNQVVNWIKGAMIVTEDNRRINRKEVFAEARAMLFEMVASARLTREPERKPDEDEVIDSIIMKVFIRKPNANQFADCEDAQRVCIQMFRNEIIRNLKANLSIEEDVAEHEDLEDDGLWFSDDEQEYELYGDD